VNRFIILIIFLISCIPLATNGSPITTPKDELSIGIGAGATSSNPLIFGFSVSARYGLSENVDVGFSGFPIILGILNTDIKFRNSDFTALIFGTGFYFSPIGSLILPNFGLGLGNGVSYLSSRFIYVLGALEDTVDRISVKQSSILQTSFGLTLGKSIKFNLEMGFFVGLGDLGGIAPYAHYGFLYMPTKKERR
jgi:hypothetical protein